jgi:autotransporter translocation and assembly factor TamB
MRASHKKALRRAGVILGGIFFVLSIVVAGALIWLRTDSGERFIANIATEALADQGFILKTESFGGPLPSRLHLTDVSLSDAKGEWFRAKEVDVRLDLFALFGKTAAVSLAHVYTPEVYRLPVLPASAPETATESAPKEPGFFKLPVGVCLDVLSLENIGIYAPLAFPEAVLKQGKPLLTLTVTGNAAAKAEKPLNASISVDSRVADMKQLAAYAGALPVDSFALRAELKAEVGEAVDAKLSGTVTPGKDGAAYPLNYDVDAKLLLNMLALPKFFVHGLDLRLDGAGGYNLASGGVNANVDFSALADGKWENLVIVLTGQKIGGTIGLKADAVMNGDRSFAVNACLAGKSMRWGTEDLQKILGPSLVLKADGKGEKRYTP